MGFEVLIPLLAIFSVILIPLTGLMIILTTKFAFKPLVETLSKALSESKQVGPGAQQWQVEELTEQIQALTDEVRRLKDVQEFDKKLLGSDASPPRGR